MWKEYMEKLYDGTEVAWNKTITWSKWEDEVRDILTEEFDKAPRCLKTIKAAGIDRIQVKLWK